MSFFNRDDNESILRNGDIYLAERVHQGVKSGYSGASTCHFTKTAGLCLKKALPAATTEIQVFEPGGEEYAWGSNTIYLGHFAGVTSEHAPEINQEVVKLTKNNVVEAEDLAGVSITFKFKIPHVAGKNWRELLYVAKTKVSGENQGLRGMSSSPSSAFFNRFFLMTVVEETTSGKKVIHQYRKVRLKMLAPSGGGSEYMSAEVEASPLPDRWTGKEFNLGADLVI